MRTFALPMTQSFAVPLASKLAVGIAQGIGQSYAAIINDAGELAPYVTFTRSSTATRYNSAGLLETVAANAPRYDYDPVTLQLRGLLIEEQRTNLLVRSQEIDNASWVKTRTTVTANAATAPDGTLSADKLIEDTNSLNHVLVQQITSVAGTVYTFSVFLKASERTLAQVQITDTAGSTQFNALVNLSDGTFTTTSAGSPTGTAASVTNVGNGFYRVAVTMPVPTTATQGIVWIRDASGATSYTGDGTSGIFVWGAQLEAGTFATSYIPTTTSAVTRVADNAAVSTLTNIGYNASEGTLFAEATPSLPLATDGVVRFVVAAYDALTYANSLRLERLYGTFRDVQTVGGASNVTGATWATGVNGKMAGAYANSNSAASFNGSSAASIAGGVPAGVTQLGIGGNNAGGNSWCGHIRRLRYYNRRLPNATLQALTAP